MLALRCWGQGGTRRTPQLRLAVKISPQRCCNLTQQAGQQSTTSLVETAVDRPLVSETERLCLVTQTTGPRPKLAMKTETNGESNHRILKDFESKDSTTAQNVIFNSNSASASEHSTHFFVSGAVSVFGGRVLQLQRSASALIEQQYSHIRGSTTCPQAPPPAPDRGTPDGSPGDSRRTATAAPSVCSIRSSPGAPSATSHVALDVIVRSATCNRGSGNMQDILFQ